MRQKDETEDRCGAEGEDRPGGVARACDGARAGPALSGSSQPDLHLEEAAVGAGGESLRDRRQPDREREVERFHAKIAELIVERDFWRGGPEDERFGPSSEAYPRPCRAVLSAPVSTAGLVAVGRLPPAPAGQRQ